VSTHLITKAYGLWRGVYSPLLYSDVGLAMWSQGLLFPSLSSIQNLSHNSLLNAFISYNRL